MSRLRIFLINAGFSRPLHPHVVPPLGLLYLAAYLRERMDTDIRVVNQRLDNISTDRLVKAIVAHDAQVVGFSVMTPASSHLKEVIRRVRIALPEAFIVLGGPHVSALQGGILEHLPADAAIPGEGERAFEAAIRARFNDGGLSGVPGIHWRSDGQVISNPGRFPLIEDLDALPFPAYDLIDLKAYWRRQSSVQIPRRRYISLFSSRGCPYGCIYCHRIFGRRFRAHSAERLLDEIAYFSRQYGVDDFDFADDIFNLDAKRVHDFRDGARKRNLRIRIAFPNGLRADALDADMIEALAETGLYHCSLALESGSPRIQSLIGKHLDIDAFERSVAGLVRKRVFTNGFLMFGFPTETSHDMEQTIRVACRSKLHTISTYTVIPFPGTALCEMAAQKKPGMMEKMDYEGIEYADVPINVSDVGDDQLCRFKRLANRRFYLNPARILRILRDHPQPLLLPMYLPALAKRLTVGLFQR